jgi:16S rRNA (cytosine967-C5)-methyltransferase
LTNAVLRKLAVAPAQTAMASHPEWLVQRWRARFGNTRTAALVAHNDRRPPLVIQPVGWSPGRLAGALNERGIAFDPVPEGSGFAVRGARVNELPGFAEGAFVVQDPAQARVLDFAAIPDGALVWDACAAPGGKAVVLAQRHRAVASDMRLQRLHLLRSASRRAAPTLPVFAADARIPPVRTASLDSVLLDAPCSATGTLARHPDARSRLTPRRIETLARLQAELLEGVAPVVRPGGLLVYATCSLEPEENELQVNGFLERHAEYRRTVDDLFVFPPESGTDGAYAARLERVA